MGGGGRGGGFTCTSEGLDQLRNYWRIGIDEGMTQVAPLALTMRRARHGSRRFFVTRRLEGVPHAAQI